MPDPNDDQPTFSNDKWHGNCDVTVQFEILNDDRLVRTTSEHTFDVTNDHVDGTFSAEYKHVIEKKNNVGGWDVVDSVATIDHMTFPVEGDGGTYDEQNLWNRNNHWHPTRTADHVCEDGAYYRLQAYTRVQPPGGFGGYVKKTRYTYWDFA